MKLIRPRTRIYPPSVFHHEFNPTPAAPLGAVFPSGI
jgi:hypothetical protein